MSTVTSQPPKPRRYRVWLYRFVLLLGLPILVYYGYCWGIWGRNSLLLQYLFQCSCPPTSEEARYPEYVDVVVPACRHFNSRLSPSGRLLYVQETESKSVATYLLNLETDEKTPFNLNGSGFFFLTDDLLFVVVQYRENEYILDRTTGETYPIQEFRYSLPGSYINGDADPIKLATALQEAKYVFLLNDYGDTLVALSPDFPASSELNFYINSLNIPGDASSSVRMEQFLKENNIAYQNIPFSYQNEVISPNGKFVARLDGIYSVETGQQIVKGIPLSSRRIWKVRGWISDGSAVIYAYFLEPCVIDITILDPVCFFEVPQPVLKLIIPEEYLMPAPVP